MEEKITLDKATIEELLMVPVAEFFEKGEDRCPPITVADAIVKTAAREPTWSRYDTMNCPCCGGIVNEWHHYCPDCGQRLDWKHIRTVRRDGNVVS